MPLELPNLYEYTKHTALHHFEAQGVGGDGTVPLVLGMLWCNAVAA